MAHKARLVFSFFAIFFLLLSPAKAQKAPKEENQSIFHIYSGGFHVLTGSFSYENDGKNYNALFEAEPHGWLGRLLPWSATLSTEGKNHIRTLQPKEFINQTKWRDEPKTVTLRYNKQGKLTEFIEDTPKHGIREKKVKEKYANDTMDVLTAVAQVIQDGQESACGKSYPVFDGKRRFDVLLGEPRQTTLKASKYNVYSGNAVKCTLSVQPISGFEKKKSWYAEDERSEEDNNKTMVWLGKRDGKEHTELVRVQVKTDLGMMIAHLAE